MSSDTFEKRTFSEQEDTVMESDAGQPLIWKWFDGEYRVHCFNRALYDRMMRWKGARHGSIYYMPDGRCEYDVTIQEEQVEKARKLLEQTKSETSEMGTNPLLNDNDLQERKPV